MPGLTAEVSTDFVVQNQQPQPLKPLFTFATDSVFISQEEIEATFAQPDGWDSFYARYPNAQGHMRLSGVGFNPQLDTALIYVDNMRNPLAGEGYLLLLRKVDGVGMTVTFKTTGRQSEGQFTVLEVTEPPGSGSPTQWHKKTTLILYVLEGALTLRVGDEMIQAVPGRQSHHHPAGIWSRHHGRSRVATGSGGDLSLYATNDLQTIACYYRTNRAQ